MTVRLDQVPALSPRPARPRIWLWLGLLPLVLLLGLGLMVLIDTQPWRQQPMHFWRLALGLSMLVWCALSFLRAVFYIGQQRAADGWDEAREKDLSRKIRCGRRSQQVLGVSLYTSLRTSGDQPAAQLDALLKGGGVLEAQPSRLEEASVRHSQLSAETDEEPEPALLRVLLQVLTDLAQTLTQLPDDKPLALLLEVDSDLPKQRVRQLLQLAWVQAGIRQSYGPIEGSGLTVIDRWLDQRIGDQALLLLLAVQLSPSEPEGKAELAVGLLFGNRLTQNTVSPVAYLHRPEQQRGATTETLIYATHQAMSWVPLDAQSIENIWQAGSGAQRNAALSTAIGRLPAPLKHNRTIHDLDKLLGHAGRAAPWLAIAAATQNIQRGAGPQFIFSGGSPVEAGLWSTVLMPVPLPSKQE